MKRVLQSERGVALLISLGAIVLIGVVITGVLFTVTQDYRISDNSLRQARATPSLQRIDESLERRQVERLRAMRGDVHVFNENRSGVRLQNAQDHIDGGRLPCAVRP